MAGKRQSLMERMFKPKNKFTPNTRSNEEKKMNTQVFAERKEKYTNEKADGIILTFKKIIYMSYLLDWIINKNPQCYDEYNRKVTDKIPEGCTRIWELHETKLKEIKMIERLCMDIHAIYTTANNDQRAHMMEQIEVPLKFDEKCEIINSKKLGVCNEDYVKNLSAILNDTLNINKLKYELEILKTRKNMKSGIESKLKYEINMLNSKIKLNLDMYYTSYDTMSVYKQIIESTDGKINPIFTIKTLYPKEYPHALQKKLSDILKSEVKQKIHEEYGNNGNNTTKNGNNTTKNGNNGLNRSIKKLKEKRMSLYRTMPNRNTKKVNKANNTIKNAYNTVNRPAPVFGIIDKSNPTDKFGKIIPRNYNGKPLTNWNGNPIDKNGKLIPMNTRSRSNNRSSLSSKGNRSNLSRSNLSRRSLNSIGSESSLTLSNVPLSESNSPPSTPRSIAPPRPPPRKNAKKNLNPNATQYPSTKWFSNGEKGPGESLFNTRL